MKKYIDLYFTTCTIHNWYPLLADDEYKEIIISSFNYCVENERASIWAFVIMDNHFHIVWQMLGDFKLGTVRQNLLKYCAQQFKFKIQNKNDISLLEKFYVNKVDRKYQFWKRNPLSIDLYNDKILEQKVNYIHNNPYRKWGHFDYKYSSYPYYETGNKNWDFLL